MNISNADNTAERRKRSPCAMTRWQRANRRARTTGWAVVAGSIMHFVLLWTHKAQATGWDLSGAKPDGAYEPDAWVLKAKDATDKGVSISDYLTAYTLTKDVESIKDSSGKTITYSRALQQMQKIYDMNFPASQSKALFEAFGISEKIWDYDRALVDSKLREMRKQ